MDPDQQAIDQLFVRKVLRARQTPPERKFLAGARLYEYARSISMKAIQADNPAASPEELRDLFRKRLKISRLLEDRP